MGIWLVKRNVMPKRGEYVLFCPKPGAISEESYARGYIKFGTCPGFYAPFLKKIAGIPFDQVQVSDHVSVNHNKILNSNISDLDSMQRKIPWKANSGILAENQYFALATKEKNSFDSRYFGPIEKSQILGTAQPIWV